MTRRRLAGLVAFNLFGLLAVAGLAWLGTWQIQRRTWKLDLIARVEARIHAEPLPAPGPSEWPGVTEASDAYRHVRLEGSFLDQATTFVQAVTTYGGGFWALTPLRRPDGSIVLINRGFVPPDRRDPSGWEAHPETVAVTGLMRMSEPGGAFLRANDPGADRWTSRDVAAIAKARGLSNVAPYFVDADAGPDRSGFPVGGLTVVTFPNNHLVYAITWTMLALMAAAAVIYVDRDALRRG